MKKAKKKASKKAEGKNVTHFKTKKKGKKKKVNKHVYHRGDLTRACFKYLDDAGVDPVLGKEEQHYEGCLQAAKDAKSNTPFDKLYYSWMRNHYRNVHGLPPKAKIKTKVEIKTNKKKTKKFSDTTVSKKPLQHKKKTSKKKKKVNQKD